MEALATLGAVVCRAVWGPKDRQGLNGKAMSTVGPEGKSEAMFEEGSQETHYWRIGGRDKSPRLTRIGCLVRGQVGCSEETAQRRDHSLHACLRICLHTCRDIESLQLETS